MATTKRAAPRAAARTAPRAAARTAPRAAPGPATVDELARRDPVLAALIKRHGPPPVRRPLPVAGRFADLAESILYQQLAGRAAATIHGRFVSALGGEITPDRVLGVSAETLRGCGLSGNKAAAITDLAAKVASGQVALDRIGRSSDDEIVDHLVQVRGIGVWTAHMFLLGAVGRPDIWPTGDYGVRAGFAAAWGLADLPTPAELTELGEPFRPYRSALAWYCWRAVDDKGKAS